MTHPDTLTIQRAVVEQALEALDLSYALLESAKSYHRPKVLDAYKNLRAALQPQAAVTTSGPPERDNSKPAEQQGVFRKFNVQRTDGSDQPGGKHHGCEYFVLDVAHDQHAKPALEAYAVACATTHPQLSADMQERYGLQAQAGAEPVAYCVYFPTEQRQEYCQDLDELCEDLTNLEHEITPLYTTPPATQAEAEQHTFNDESPFCVKCGSTGEDAEGPVAHILPRDLKILKFKSMPVPVDPLPYDNGEEKTVPLYTSPPATQAALTAALGALKRLAKRDGWKPFVTEDANDQWKPAEQDGLDAIAQLEALGE